MRVHTFRHGGASTLSYYVEKNYILSSIGGRIGFVVSSDPSMTYNSWVSIGPAGDQTDDWYISNEAGASSTIFQLFEFLNFELSAGMRIFSSTIAAGNVQLFLVEI